MLAKLKLPFFYWIIWIGLFQIARLLFTLYSIEDTLKIGLLETSKVFLYGLKMDLSMASYILVPFSFILFINDFIKFSGIHKILLFYTVIILIPISIIITADLPAFKAWGYRLDATPLKYLSSPNEAWASISHLPLTVILICWSIILLTIIKIFNHFLHKLKPNQSNDKQKLLNSFSLLLFIIVQIIPIRGGTQLAPLNQSSIYFSKNNFANLAAINVTWNFLHSLSQNLNDTSNPFNYLDKSIANKLTEDLFVNNTITTKIIDSTKNPNVIIIIWESLTKKVIDEKKDGQFITPNFNTLKKEGVYFSDLYATGDRTDKGIVGVLSGYPSQPITSIIKIPQKADKLPKLPKVFADLNYNTSFYYGGELEFANMKSYLLGAGYKSFVDKDNFESKDQNSKWGAHDGIVENKIIEYLQNNPSPFFTTWLTLSSHEPYETPVNPVIKGNDDVSLFLNSLHYTDSIVNHFVSYCKKQSFWNNTIIVIVADHGHRLPRSENKIEDFKIPMLWLGGALLKNGITINNTGSQIDIAATLLSQLNLPHENYKWSKDILSKQTSQWAYFSFNNGFGFVEPENYFIFDNVGKSIIEHKREMNSTEINIGKSLQQNTFADYLSK